MPIALIGGEEFADGFEDVHARLAHELIARKPNGRELRLAFLPTCAAGDGPASVERWCRTAEARLSAEGVRVRSLPIVDRRSAGDADLVAWLRQADWIYFGGGYPHVAIPILAGTPALEAVRAAWQSGALVAGASGGAMLLCSRAWVVTPELESAIDALRGQDESAAHLPGVGFVDGIGLLPATLCWPHMNLGFSLAWLRQGALPPQHTLIGLDEQTAVVTRGGAWQVLGRGRARIVDPGYIVHDFVHGETIPAPVLSGANP